MENKCNVKPPPKSIKEFLKSSSFWKPFIAVVIGGIAGFAYYHYVGCVSGSCPITNNPYLSILAGSLFGLFIIKRPCSSCR